MHGMEPSVFLRGKQLSDLLSSQGEVYSSAVGTTCIKAIFDCNLQDEIEYFRHATISGGIASLEGEWEAVVVLNQAKNSASSLRFRSILADSIRPPTPPILYVDNFAASLLSKDEHPIFQTVLDWAGMELSPVPEHDDGSVREVHGAIVGESIWVNGSVIGRVSAPVPRLWKDDDGELQFEGIDVKEHGLEHAGDFDPFTAKIRTGISSPVLPSPQSREVPKSDRAAIIDHNAEKGLRYAHDCLYAVTVGDDTTKNASSLLYRFSIPVIGIIDGDEDGICQEDLRYPGSRILMVRPGCDDIVGREVAAAIFKDERTLESPPSLESMAAKIREIAGERLISIHEEKGNR